MQCVGTLSWSVIGLASPASHPRDKNLSPGTPASPSRRTLEGPGNGSPRPAAGHVPGGKAITPALRPARVEVNPLEVDWSQVVRLCMNGDSGAWAELVRTHHRRVYGLCYRFTGNPSDAEDLT